jgi:hypothetical protein
MKKMGRVAIGLAGFAMWSAWPGDGLPVRHSRASAQASAARPSSARQTAPAAISVELVAKDQ